MFPNSKVLMLSHQRSAAAGSSATAETVEKPCLPFDFCPSHIFTRCIAVALQVKGWPLPQHQKDRKQEAKRLLSRENHRSLSPM